MNRRLRPRQRWGVGVLVASAGLVCIVAVAAEGSPLEAAQSSEHLDVGDQWQGIVLGLLTLAALGFLAMIVWSLAAGPSRATPAKRRSSLVRNLVLLAVTVAAVMLLRPLTPEKQDEPAPPSDGQPSTSIDSPPASGGGEPLWPVVLLAATVVGVLGVAAATGRRRGDAPDGAPADDGAESDAQRDAAVDAFDASLADLEAEPDARRAIIAAYARLLSGFGRGGLGRLPHEAPVEHLRRALTAVAMPPAPVERLVELFVEARFSDHPLGPPDKQAAIDAFVAARDDLRAHLVAWP